MNWHRVFFVCCLVFSSSALGKPFTLDEAIEPYRLDLTAVESRPGSKAVGVQGVTVEKGHYFYVKGHGMTQPVDVILEAPEDRNLSLEIFLSTWQQPVRTGNTQDKGITTHKLTAYGEFGIRVTGPSVGTPYLLSVHAHPEVTPTLANPFKPAETPSSSNTGAIPSADVSDQNGMLLYAVIGLLVVVIVLLAALLLKKRSAAVILLGLCLASWVSLTPSPAEAAAGETAADYDYDNLRVRAGGFEQPPPASSWSGMSTEQANQVWDGGVKTIEYLKKLKEGWDAYQSLDGCMSIDSPPEMPLVPSFCAVPAGMEDSDGGSYIMNSGQDCSQCFTDSRMAFNKARLDLEKLRVIYSCTKKMSNAAIAAGDSMSGIHGYSGVVWQGMRYDIVRSVENMEKAYDKKYPELMKTLQNSMVDMAICEAQYGTPDWYDRFGFIYFEFMRDAYKRKD